jgi:type I restriction enzyme S subunit
MMKLSDFLQETARPVPKPKAPYRRLGLRNRGQGTFLTIADPEKIEMDTLYEVVPNELIVNITFAWEGAITLTSDADRGALVSHRFPTFRFDERKVLPSFFRYVTRTPRFVYHLGLVSPGGAGRNRVMSKRDFQDIAVPIPSIAEQYEISSCLNTLEGEVVLLKGLLDQFMKQKRGLMQQLLTGKIRVKV